MDTDLCLWQSGFPRFNNSNTSQSMGARCPSLYKTQSYSKFNQLNSLFSLSALEHTAFDLPFSPWNNWVWNKFVILLVNYIMDSPYEVGAILQNT